MSLSQIAKYHLNDFQIDWISNKANKVAINANFTRKSFIPEYGGRDRALLGRSENLKISPKFSNQKIIKLPRCLEDVTTIDNTKSMSWEKCLALYAEIRKANACDHQQTTWIKWYQNFHSEGARICQLQFLEWRSELFSRKAREKDVMLCEHLPSKMKSSYGKLRFQTFSTFLSSFRKKLKIVTKWPNGQYTGLRRRGLGSKPGRESFLDETLLLTVPLSTRRNESIPTNFQSYRAKCRG